MPKKKSIGFFTIYLSRRYYLNEVPVEGKSNSKFFRRLGMYKEYISQILRTGNCISLISTPITIEEDSFWNTNHFEDLAKNGFWIRDVFLCHAWDDRKGVAKELHDLLGSRGVSV